MEKKKSCPLNVRVSEQDKATIEAIAKTKGTSVSQYVRTVALSDPGSLFLESGKVIAESLGRLSADLHDMAVDGNISDKSCALLLAGIEEIMVSLRKITAWISAENGGAADVNTAIDEDED